MRRLFRNFKSIFKFTTSMKKKILAVDDDSTFSTMIKTYLQKNGYEVFVAGNVNSALELLKSEKPDLILSDYRMPGRDGLEFLSDLNNLNITAPLVLMTGFGDIRLAVRAMKLGARDYLTKPVNPSELLEVVQSILAQEEAQSTQQPSTNSPKEAITKRAHSYIGENFVNGISENWKQIQEHIELVAPTPMSVIILGESGTGKEFVARRLHDLSQRADKPFVAIDCGALNNEIAASEFFGHLKGAFTGAIQDKVGQFEAANGGTIFLDEIGNLSYEVQIMLLRALQERQIRKVGGTKNIEVDVRVIVATNENLESSINKGVFREDLYHRLNEFSIYVAPLRARTEDIPLFADRFLLMANEELNKSCSKFTDEVMNAFSKYVWPGNLREFKNVVKRAVLLSKHPVIGTESLPKEIFLKEKDINLDQTVDLKVISESMERNKILEALEKVKYNKSKAAQILNIDRKTLYNKIKLYGLEV